MTDGNTPFRIQAVGDIGILVEAASAECVRALAKWVARHRHREALTEVIPAARTLFLTGDPTLLRDIEADLRSRPDVGTAPDPREGRRLTIDVRYDGPDLSEVAERTGLTCRQVVDMHSGTDYVVDFFGFAPGQAFFAGLPEALQLPRRRTPRTHVPAGSLAIANGFTVIYPQNSPGGWNLIGTRVSEPLWDITQTPPNRVNVGDVVSFRECR